MTKAGLFVLHSTFVSPPRKWVNFFQKCYIPLRKASPVALDDGGEALEYISASKRTGNPLGGCLPSTDQPATANKRSRLFWKQEQRAQLAGRVQLPDCSAFLHGLDRFIDSIENKKQNRKLLFCGRQQGR